MRYNFSPNKKYFWFKKNLSVNIRKSERVVTYWYILACLRQDSRELLEPVFLLGQQVHVVFVQLIQLVLDLVSAGLDLGPLGQTAVQARVMLLKALLVFLGTVVVDLRARNKAKTGQPWGEQCNDL